MANGETSEVTAASVVAKAAATTAGDHFSRGQTEKNRQEVKRWNRLTIADRSVVSFKAADLTGCDLTGINLKGVTSADRSSFTRTILVDARLTASFRKAS